MQPYVDRLPDGAERAIDLSAPPDDALRARLADLAAAPYARPHDIELLTALVQRADPAAAFDLLSPHFVAYEPARSVGYPLFHELLVALSAQWGASGQVDPRWFPLVLSRFPEIPEVALALTRAKHPDKRALLLERFAQTGEFPRGLLAAAANAKVPEYAPVFRDVMARSTQPRDRLHAIRGLLAVGNDDERPALREAALALLEKTIQEPDVAPLLEALATLAAEDDVVEGLRRGIAWRTEQRRLYGRVDKADQYERSGLARDIAALKAALARLRPPTRRAR